MKNIFIILLILSISSCATYKPDSNGVSAKDYNGRLNINDAHYNKRTNAIGYASMAVAAAAGGYAAYEYGDGIVTYYDKGEKKNLKPADAALGAITAFTLSYLTNKLISKPNKIKTNINTQQWMRDVGIDDEYNMLSSYSNNLRIIDKTYENKFSVRNYNDVQDFERAFPNSLYIDDILSKSINKVSRSQLYTLINKYPKTRDIKVMQLEYIKTAPNIAEFYKSFYAYPNAGFNNKESYVSSLVKKADRSDLPNIISSYKNDSDINLVKNEYFEDSPTLLDLYKAQEKYKSFKFSNFDKRVYHLLPKAKRNTLKKITNNYPKDKHTTSIKSKYINLSSNLNQLLEAKQLYSDFNYDYNNKALDLLEKLNDLPLYEQIASTSYIQKGKMKIDKILWNSAKKHNTINAYNSYLQNSPVKSFSSSAYQEIENIKRVEAQKAEEERLAKIKKDEENQNSIREKGHPLITYESSPQSRGLFNTGKYIDLRFYDSITTVVYIEGWSGANYGKYYVGLDEGRWYYDYKSDAILGAYCLAKFGSLCSNDKGYRIGERSYSNSNSSSGNGDYKILTGEKYVRIDDVGHFYDSFGSISIIDGGGLLKHICTDYYSVIYTNAEGKITKSTNNYLDSSGSILFPVVVEINYRKRCSENNRYIKIKFNKAGEYNVNLD